MPKSLTDSIWAIAILMANVTAQHTANEITLMVKTQLQEHPETFATNVETMRDTVEHVTGAAKEFTATQEMAERNTNKVNTATMAPNFTYQPMTYANVIQQHVPPAHGKRTHS